METLKVTPHEHMTILHNGDDRLEVEVTYAPRGKKPPAHYHPEQYEHFDVLAGELHAIVDGGKRVLTPGDTMNIGRGAVHQMWNPGDDVVRAKWTTTPGGRTYEWFAAIDALHRAGRVDKSGMPGPLAFGVLLTEYRDVFRLAAKPEPVVRGAMAALGAVGRARGYSAHA